MVLRASDGLNQAGLRAGLSGYTLLDGFESGSLDSDYGGDTSSANIVTDSGVTNGTVEKGTYALGGSVDEISRTDVTVSKGNSVRCWGYADGGSQSNLSFLFMTQSDSSSPNSYRIYWVPPNGTVEINDQSNSNTIAQVSYGFNQDTWYIFEVVTDTSDNMTIKLFDAGLNQLGSASGSDTQYSSGGIGFRLGGVDNYGYWDHVQKQ